MSEKKKSSKQPAEPIPGTGKKAKGNRGANRTKRNKGEKKKKWWEK